MGFSHSAIRGYRVCEANPVTVANDTAADCEAARQPELYLRPTQSKAPDSRRPRVRTVWQMDKGAVAPRLISAYPLEAL